MKTMKHVQSLGLIMAGALVLAGCASTRGEYDVPVVDGEPSTARPAVSASSIPTPPRRAVATVDVPEGGHIVRKGDTLYNVAARYGLTPRELADMNQLPDPNHITLGQTLRVNRRASILSRSVEVPAASRVTEVHGSNGGDSAIEVHPLVPDSSTGRSLETRDVSGGGDSPTTVRVQHPQKTPYSEDAWKAAQREKAEHGEKTNISHLAESASKQPYSENAWKQGQEQRPVSRPITKNGGDDDGNIAEGAAAVGSQSGDEGLDFLWPVQGRILQGFSATNKGVDIAGKLGQPVAASTAGKVVYVGSGLRGYGQLIILKHSKQFLTAYAHNRQILVKEGQEVNRGQKIAEMGNTDSDQVKLHFEVRKLGKPVDPIKYLPER